MQRIISRFLLLAVAALFVRVASADMQLLYFMLNNPTFDGSEETPNYSFAMVAFTDSDGKDPTGDYLTLYGGGGTAQGQAVSSDSTEPLYVGLGESYSTTDYILFELWLESPQGSYERVAYASESLGNLSSYIVSSTAMGGVIPYPVHDVHPVPEPTSGLLVLLGAAVLALRRKRI